MALGSGVSPARTIEAKRELALAPYPQFPMTIPADKSLDAKKKSE